MSMKQCFSLLLLYLCTTIAVNVRGSWPEKGCYTTMDNESNSVTGTFTPRKCFIQCKENGNLFAGIRNKRKCYCFKTAQGMQGGDKFSETCSLTRYRLEQDIVDDVKVQSNVLFKNEDIIVNVIYYGSANFKKEETAYILSRNFTINNIKILNSSIQEKYTRTMKIYTIRNSLEVGKYKFCYAVKDLSHYTIRNCVPLVVEANIYIFSGNYVNVSRFQVAAKVNTSISLTGSSKYLSTYSIFISKLTTQFDVVFNNNTSNVSFSIGNTGEYDLSITSHNSLGNEKFSRNVNLRKFLLIQEEISRICLETQRAVFGKSTKFKISVYGSQKRNTYEWYFNDKFVIQTNESYILHTILKQDAVESMVTVKIKAKNYVSEVVVKSFIMLHDDLSGLKIIAEPNPVLEGSVVRFYTNLNSSSATINWYIDNVPHRFREFNITSSAGVKNITVIVTVQSLTPGKAKYLLYVVKKVAPFPIHYKLNLKKNYQVQFSIEFSAEQFNGFNKSYNPTYTWDLGDNTPPVETTTKSYVHQYKNIGTYHASVNISNYLSYYISSVKVVLQKKPCNTQIFFPWKYKVTKNFLWSERIDVAPVVIIEECSDSKTVYQWEIWDDEEKILKFRKISYFEKSLSLPSKFLSPGCYLFKFKVHFKNNTKHEDLNIFTRDYNGSFCVNRTGIKVRFKDHQDYFHIQVLDRSYAKEIVFDASPSYDIDSPMSQQPLNFRWTCDTNAGTSNCFKKSKVLNMSLSVMKFNINMLSLKAEQFYFKVVVAKQVDGDKSISGNSSILLDLRDENVSKRTMIECTSCVNNHQLLETVTRMKFTCPQCNSNEKFNIKWTLYRKHKLKDTIFFKHKTKPCILPVWPQFESAVWNVTNSSTIFTFNSTQPLETCFEKNSNGSSNQCKDKCSYTFKPTPSLPGVESKLKVDRLKTVGFKQVFTSSPSSTASRISLNSAPAQSISEMKKDNNFNTYKPTLSLPSLRSKIKIDSLKTIGSLSSTASHISNVLNSVVGTQNYTSVSTQNTSEVNKVKNSTKIVSFNYLSAVGHLPVKKFNVMEDMFIPKTEKNEILYSNEKEFLYIKPTAFIPGYDYLITGEFQQNKMKIGSAKLLFTVNEPPKQGECEVIGSESGNEIDDNFNIKCWNYKNPLPLVYTVERKNTVSGKYDVILISNEHYLVFVLHSSKQQNQTKDINFKNITVIHHSEKVSIRITVENTVGEKVTLCPITVYVNSTLVTLRSLHKKVNNILIGKLNTNQKLNYIITILHKIQSMTIEDENSAASISQTICLKLKELQKDMKANDSPVMIMYTIKLLLENATHQLQRGCVDDMVKSYEAIMKFVLTSRTLYKNATSDEKFIEYSYQVVNLLLRYFRNIDNRTMITKLIHLIARNQEIMYDEKKIEEYYMNLNLDEIIIYAIKKVSTNKKLQLPNGFTLDIINEQDSCLDMAFHSYSNISIFQGIKSTHRVFFNKCWNDQTEPIPNEYYLNFPPKVTTETIYRIDWEKINHHAVVLNSHESDYYYVIIDVKKKSENNMYFDYRVTLRSNKSVIIEEKVYNSGKAVQANMNFFFAANTINTSRHEIMVEIIPRMKVYRKKINSPWFYYSLSVSSLSCRSAATANSTTNQNFCVPSVMSEVDRLKCRCNSPGLVAGEMNEVTSTFTVVHVDTSIKPYAFTLLSAIGLALVVLLMIIYFRFMEKRKATLNFLDLPENLPCDHYEYHLLIETGHMENAGTSARICAILYGTDGHSEKMELTFQKKDMFQRCSSECIAIRCPQHLGELKMLKLWHNAKGAHPDWYIKQIVIKDKLTGVNFYFPFFNWLSFSKGIKQTHVELGASLKSCNNNMQVFCKKFLDYHLWLSILFGHSNPKFTKIERLAVLLSIIFFIFVGSEIFANKPFMQEDIYLLGFLHIESWDVVYASVALILCALPLNFFLSFIFRTSYSLNDENNETKRNKIGDSYYIDSSVPSYGMSSYGSLSGAMFYQQSTQEQMIFRSANDGLSNNTENETCNIKLPYSLRWLARVLVLSFIVSALAFICWRADYLSLDTSMKILQLVLLAVIFDIIVLSTAMALAFCWLFIILFPQGYKDLFSKFSLHLINERQQQSDSYDDEHDNIATENKLYVRNRSRFIRYAEPYSYREMKKKKHKKQKKDIVKKCLSKLLICALLVVVVVILFQEETQDIQITQTQIKTSLFPSNNSEDQRAFWYTMKQQVAPLLKSNMCNNLFYLKNVMFTQNPTLLNPVMLHRQIRGIEERTVLTCGRLSSPLKDMDDLEENAWFNNNVTQLQVKYNVLNKRKGKNIYSMVSLKYTKMHNDVYSTVKETHSVHYEEDCVQDFKTFAILLLKVSLLVIVCVLMYNGFSRCMQYGWKDTFKLKRILNILITLFCFALFCICASQCVVSNLFQTSLNAAKLDIYEVDGIFYYLHALVELNEITRLVKGLFFFVVLIKCSLLLKLIPTNFILLNVMGKTFKSLFSYFVFLFLLLMACSHIWFMLIAQSLDELVTYANIMEYIAVHLYKYQPRIFINDTSRWRSAFGLFSSIALYLAIRVSVIFFIGVIREEKMKKKKVATFHWLFNNRTAYFQSKWMQLKEVWWRRRTPGNIVQYMSRRKKSRGHSKLPKKYILDEIDYQSEELLYRINKLAQIDDEYDDQMREFFFRCNKNLSPILFEGEEGEREHSISDTNSLPEGEDVSQSSTYESSTTFESTSSNISPTNLIHVKAAVNKDSMEKPPNVHLQRGEVSVQTNYKKYNTFSTFDSSNTTTSFNTGRLSGKSTTINAPVYGDSARISNVDGKTRQSVTQLASERSSFTNPVFDAAAKTFDVTESVNHLGAITKPLKRKSFDADLKQPFARPSFETDSKQSFARPSFETDLSQPFTRPSFDNLKKVDEDSYVDMRRKLELLKTSVKTVKPDQVQQHLKELRDREHACSLSSSSDKNDSGFDSFDMKSSLNSPLKSQFQHIFPKLPTVSFPRHEADAFDHLEKVEERKRSFNKMLDKLMSTDMNSSYLNKFVDSDDEYGTI